MLNGQLTYELKTPKEWDSVSEQELSLSEEKIVKYSESQLIEDANNNFFRMGEWSDIEDHELVYKTSSLDRTLLLCEIEKAIKTGEWGAVASRYKDHFQQARKEIAYEQSSIKVKEERDAA